MQLRSKSSISASYLEKTNGLAQGLAFLVELLHSVGFGHGLAVKRRENKTSRKSSVRS
jgi:hypothetical protein